MLLTLILNSDQNTVNDSKVNSNGTWTVTVIPENTTGVQEMVIEVNTSGTAFITVNSSRRSPVGYNGFIEN